MKAQNPWYNIPLERENYQLPQYVDYNLFPLNIYDITDVGSKTDTYIVLQVSSFSEIYTKTRISFVNDSNYP
jgi:hypothetical protein